jgi:hypothetical protein
MYYLIAINSRDGRYYSPLGNDGQRRGAYKQPSRIARQARALAVSTGAEHVYKLPAVLYSALICELSNGAFCRFVAERGEMLV